MRNGIAGRSYPNSPRVALVALTLSVGLMAPLSARAGATPKAADAVTLTDANIAAIVLAANTIDIKNGNLAIARAKTTSVGDFARQMVRDHTSVNKKAADLAARLKLVPKENRTSRALVASADSTRN
ncbi:MAG TPA: DUF4142 domain-containing protein, partial [Tepidiformaceae bacterium]|nr:DUF4142 domain-containing protein [Tepidiformaceae bacterium]